MSVPFPSWQRRGTSFPSLERAKRLQRECLQLIEVAAPRFALGGYCDEAKWPEIQEANIDAMIRRDHAVRPHIAKLSN
jgi:hypothetical protein